MLNASQKHIHQNTEVNIFFSINIVSERTLYLLEGSGIEWTRFIRLFPTRQGPWTEKDSYVAQTVIC